MVSKSFGRECLKAFLKYARPSPEGQGTIDLGMPDPPGGLPRHGLPAGKREKDQLPGDL